MVSPQATFRSGGPIVAGPHVVSTEEAALPFLVVVTSGLEATAITAVGHQEKEAGTPGVAPPVPVMGSLAPALSAWWR